MELKRHRRAFKGVSYQYFGICGDGAKDCSPVDSRGDSHFVPGHQGLPGQVSPADLAEQLRAGLGEDLDLYRMISFGDTNDTALLQRLWSSPA